MTSGHGASPPRPRPPPACRGSSSGHAPPAAARRLPTVKIMVGGIDKQIYLPYQLAQNLGFYKKYGVNVELSTEQNGGVGAEDAMASGQVDMAGAWYIHTDRLPVARARTSSTSCSSPARRASARCAPPTAACTRRPTSRARRSASPTSARAPTS